MKKSLGMTLAALVLSGMFLTGCSSKPSEDEMKQLESLKAEVTSLEQKVSDLESQKAALQKAIAEKDAQLKKCADDKAAVQKNLQGM
jgi:outer membrane murein-binding lipoprotein Lpp